MTEYNTRNLTADEAEVLIRGLTLKLGKHSDAMAVLRVLADQGLGVFVATKA